MKKLFKIPCLIMTLIILAVSSGCEKDNQTTTELLTAHIWRFDKVTTTSADEDIQNAVALVNALMTGATLVINADGTYTLTILNQDDDGTWQLSADEEKLIMDNTDEMTIVKLTENELIMSGTEVDEDLGPITSTLYWKK
jgi:hypothetical protein